MLHMDSGGGGGSVKASEGAGAGVVSSSQFPAGLRVLVVDDDPTCLKILEKMLRTCLYEVITCSRAVVALTMLRERKYMFDLVISDVHMPDMDGFKLLEHIGLEMDLPVIMMSVDDKKEVVMKGVTHGACDYLIKPVRIEAIRNVWQHVVRKRRNELKELEQSGSVEDNDRNNKASEDADYTSSVNEGSWKNSKKRKEEEDELDERDDTSTLKKPRVVWSVELHQQFVAAVNQLDIDKAVPKKILELMNVPGLTRENVASHLQKYRLYLRRLSGVSQHQNGLNSPFMCSQEANFGSMSTFDGLDLQTLAVSGQLPPNSFATLQAGGLARSAVNTGIGMSHFDQRNPFSTEASKIRFGGGQQINANNKQVDLYHGLPTTIEPKQLPHLHQPVSSSGSTGQQVSEGITGFMSLPSLGTHPMTHNGIVHVSQSNPLMMQMAQSRSRGHLLNEGSSSQASGSSMPLGQHILSNEMASRVLGGRNVTVLNGRATPYAQSSQASSVLDFQTNHTLELPVSGFPGSIGRGVSNVQATGMFQDRGSLDGKGPRGFAPSFGIFDEHPESKNQEWDSHNINSTFEASQHTRPPLPGNITYYPPVLPHQGLASNQKTVLSGNTSNSANNVMVSLRERNHLGSSESILPVDNPFRVKAETIGDMNGDNPFLYDQGDLMTAILKQQQGVGQVENDFGFDGILS